MRYNISGNSKQVQLDVTDHFVLFQVRGLCRNSKVYSIFALKFMLDELRGKAMCLGLVDSSRKHTNAKDARLQGILFFWGGGGSQIREGNIVVLQDKLFEVIKYNYTQGHGRQLGVVQMDVKALEGGLLQQERRRPSDMMEVASLESRRSQLLYLEGGRATLMDPETFDQFEVDAEALFGQARQYIQEGSDVLLHCTSDGVPIRGEVPQMVTLEVVETEPGGSAYKAAVLASGARLMVPPYVSRGERIVVDTTTGTFAGRATS
eukprot:jgi/Botrbrau1/6510/Bobra.0034s0083.1